jgi:hypothetical protein
VARRYDGAWQGITVASAVDAFIQNLDTTIFQTVERLRVTYHSVGSHIDIRPVVPAVDSLKDHQLGDPEPYVTELGVLPIREAFHPNEAGNARLAAVIQPEL